MSAWLIAATGLAYLVVAVEQAARGAGWLAIVYAGYAFSNIGLYALATRGAP